MGIESGLKPDGKSDNCSSAEEISGVGVTVMVGVKVGDGDGVTVGVCVEVDVGVGVDGKRAEAAIQFHDENKMTIKARTIGNDFLFILHLLE